MAQSTAQEVLDKHSAEMTRRQQEAEGEMADTDSRAGDSARRSSGGPKAAPGMGVRLNNLGLNSTRPATCLYRRGAAADKPQRKEKFLKLLAGPITPLGEFTVGLDVFFCLRAVWEAFLICFGKSDRLEGCLRLTPKMTKPLPEVAEGTRFSKPTLILPYLVAFKLCFTNVIGNTER